MDYKKAFYSRLEDCYLGAKIKQAQSHRATLQESKAQDEQASQKAQSKLNTAQSGFTNLLMIKERYFTHIKAHLEARIKALVGDDIIETNDIYNKLYTFFDNYLNETGTPFFTDTPIYKNIYAKIYSNSKDTSLFYKTQNLYYVKSDTLYQSLILQSNTGKFSLYFDASEFKQNADNNKNKVFFKFDDISFVSASEQDEKSAFENSSENSILQITIKVSNQKDLFPNLSAVFKSNSNEFSDEFLKTLSQRQIISKKPTQSELDELKKLFRAYKKQNEIDFFIHKDALGFLKEQFDLWMFSYLYKDSEFQEWSAFAIKRLQMVKNLAYELIEFIAKFENELKAIWLKPKFAKNTQYVFSIDTILSKAQNANTLLASIFEDANFHTQITEWKELNLVENDFDILSLKDFVKTCHTEQSEGEVSKNKNANITNSLDSSLSAKAQNDKKIDISPMTQNEKYKFLPIDTKHLSKENKFALLNAFENLETLLNGELIKSDNFQALNTLMPKYQGKIDLIYIDPPFNTGSDFEYKDKFQDSTWLSLMENRLELAKNLLSDKGSFYLHLDENADYKGRLLIEHFFDFLECKKITFDTNATKDEEADLFGYKSFGNNFALKSSTIFFMKNEISIFNKLWKPNRNTSNLNLGQLDLIAKAKTNSPKKIEDFDYFIEKYSNNDLIMQKIDLNSEKIYPVGDIWNDIYSFTQSEMRVSENISFYSSQKPENMLRRIIQASSNKGDLVCDFFCGSGTTLSVAHKLKRKYLGIEMGEHFYEKYIAYNKETKKEEYRLGLLGRMKNVIAGDKDFFAIGKKRRSSLSKSIDYKGGGAFRYYELESYEEVLANCEYVLKEPHPKSLPQGEGLYSPSLAEGDKGGGYLIIDYRKSRKLIKELNKEPNKPVTLNMSGYRAEFNIFQTIANLMGWKIKRLFLDNGEQACEYDNGEILRADNINLGNEKLHKLKNLIWWE